MQITQSIRERATALVEPVAVLNSPAETGHTAPAASEYLLAHSRLTPDEDGDPHSEWADREADRGVLALDPDDGVIILTLHDGGDLAVHVLDAESARLRAYELLALADLADEAHPPAPLDRFARLKRDILAVAEGGDDPSNVRLGRIVKIVRDGDETGV